MSLRGWLPVQSRCAGKRQSPRSQRAWCARPVPTRGRIGRNGQTPNATHTNKDAIGAMRLAVLASATGTVDWLRGFSGERLEMLKPMPFKTVGCDPLSHKPLNVVEQLNQTFTILVTL